MLNVLKCLLTARLSLLQSQRIKPNEVADTLNRASSSEGDEESGQPAANEENSAVGKAEERKKLLEQLKAVEAAIAAKKQPLSKMARRKM